MTSFEKQAGRPRVTLQTIADRLQVSRTTVSNAFGKPNQLNPALRQQILDLARELGYPGPNPAARTLRRGRSGSLGVIFPETLVYAVTDPAALLLLRGIAEASEAARMALWLAPVPPDREAGIAAVRDAVVDGFVVYSLAEDDARLQILAERAMPTVIVDEPPLPGAAFVGIDDRAGARAAAEHLLALGHRRFGVVTFPLADDDYTGPADLARQAAATIPISRARLAGYADALAAAGLPWDEVPVQETRLNEVASGEAAASALLDRSPRPTAIMAFSDLLAIGALRAAATRGLRVPADLSVIGFDDIPAAAMATPPLTTVRQPLLEKGRIAGRLLLDGWPANQPPTLRLPTDLVVRASTGPAPP
jgi:DNA-binding LacI/PurR family transcriptional regulator